MKYLFTLVIILAIGLQLTAQSPEMISYQAVVRDSENNLLTNQQAGIQVSILKGAADGNVVYTETHTPTTNANGLVTITIGLGTTSDNFSQINWEDGPYFIKTEIDPAGGTTYEISVVNQLLSVPYALHAKTADSLTEEIKETDPEFKSSEAAKITSADIAKWNAHTDTKLTETEVDAFVANNGYLTAEVDGDVSNELQAISISNDTIYLTDGGFVKLPDGFSGSFNDLTNVPAKLDTDDTDDFDGAYSSLTGAPTNVSSFTNDAGYLTTEVDGDASNELQVLSISNDTVYLTDGGSVKLPAGFSGSFNDLTDVPTDLDTDDTDDFDGAYSSLTGAPTNVSSFTNDAGYLTTEVDGDASNELQVLSISNDTIYLTDGGYVKLPAGFSGSFNDLTDVPTDLDTDDTDDFDGVYSSLTGAPTNVSSFTNDAGYLTTEVDGDASNELQVLSISNDTVYLTDGGSVKLPAGFSGSFNDLTDVPTDLDTNDTDDFDGAYSSLTGAPTKLSSFTNDTGYLTSVDGTDIALGSDTQGDIMFYDGTNWVRLAAGTAGQVLQTNGAGVNPTWEDASAGDSVIAVTAYASSTTTLSSGSWSQVNLATEEIDTGNDFSSNTFTVPTTGYYHITFQLGIQGSEFSGGGNVYIGIRKNSTVISQSNVRINAAHDIGVTCSATLYLTSGTTIDFVGKDDTGSTADVYNDQAHTRASIFLIGE